MVDKYAKKTCNDLNNMLKIIVKGDVKKYE